MKEIIVCVPDDFSYELCDFIKRSAYNQVEAEMQKTLVVPQKDIDAVKVKTDEIKTAMEIVDTVSETVAPIDIYSKPAIIEDISNG